MKREFFIQSCLHQKINTFGNVKTFDVIRKKLCVVEKHLSEIEKSEELDLEVLESLRTILEMFDGLDRSGIDEKDDIYEGFYSEECRQQPECRQCAVLPF